MSKQNQQSMAPQRSNAQSMAPQSMAPQSMAPQRSNAPQSAAPQSMAPQRSNAPQSMAPQSTASQRPMSQSMSQSRTSVDPRLRQDQSVDQPQGAAAAAVSGAAFDPRAASGVSQRKILPKFRAIDNNTKKVYPSQNMIQQAVALALQLDKPIILTFWHHSIVGNVILRENKEENEKIIYKIPEHVEEEEEFTSPIVNEHGNGIFETQNSIYIVVPDIRSF